MASFLYTSFKNELLKGNASVNLDTTDGAEGVYVALVDTSIYTADETHASYADLTTSVAAEGEILNKSFSAGTFDGDDLTIATVGTAATDGTLEGLVIFRKEAGVAAHLVAFIDSADVVNLPLTTNGGSVTVTWNALGIFTL